MRGYTHGKYTQAREGGARGAPKAAEREGPLSQNIGVSDMVLQEPVVEGATGRGGTWSEQHRTNGFLTLWGKPGARGGSLGGQ
jgi:hypothetical protein